MSKTQVAKIKPQKVPYVTPRIVSFKVDPKMISTDTDIDPLADLQQQGQQEQEVRIGWKEYLAVAIGSILGYVLFRMIHGSELDSATHIYVAVTASY
jgi:hypothetical protein